MDDAMDDADVDVHYCGYNWHGHQNYLQMILSNSILKCVMGTTINATVDKMTLLPLL